jgi:hypothetical protein
VNILGQGLLTPPISSGDNRVACKPWLDGSL